MVAEAAQGTSLGAAIENASGDWWFQGAQRALELLSRRRGSFTVDDLIELTGPPPCPNYPGAAFAVARRRGLVEPHGCRVAPDGRMVRTWFGARR